MDTVTNTRRRHAGWLEQQRREAADRAKPGIVELTEADLESFLDLVHRARRSPRTHTVRITVDDGVKIKINEDIWSRPLGEVRS